MPRSLLEIWRSSLEAAHPRQLLGPCRSEALLCWGKAAGACHRAAGSTKAAFPGPALVISPETAPVSLGPGTRWIQGEHPLPGSGSFAAGEALLEFFDQLRRLELRTLEIRLTGGASSLAWLPPADLSRASLLESLAGLYRRPVPISELNRLRSQLCVLKGGGAARWLRKLAPRVTARVRLVSDVLPYGPEVVGSGPFFGEGIPHETVFDNRSWVTDLARRCRREGIGVLRARAAVVRPWNEWVEEIAGHSRDALRRGLAGVIIEGGEPLVRLPRRSGRGGRMTQMATALAWALREPLLAGRVEILCGASDGVDGRSGASGAWIDAAVARRLLAKRTAHPSRAIARKIAQDLRGFDTAGGLAANGGLIAWPTAARALTNVQDVVMVRVTGMRKSRPSA